MDTNITEAQLIIDDAFLEKRPLSKSSLKQFRKSPKHYIEYITTPYEEKPAYVIGKACEQLLMDPERFNDHFEAYQKFAKQSQAAKDQWNQMVEDAKASKKTLIDQDQYMQASIMAQNALANDSVRYWVERSRNLQKKLNWIDKKTGLPIIGFIDFDAVEDERLYIVDIKTDYNGDPDKWLNHAADLDYIMDVGTYCTGYHKMHYQFPEFKFMIIESSSPYNAHMINCPSNYVNDAKMEFENTLLAFRYCMDNQQFHMGYDFWLFDTLSGFTMQKPRWKKSKFLTT